MEFEVECRATAEVHSIVRVEADSSDEAEELARGIEKDWEVLTVRNIEYCGAKTE
jgi:hypothetical protein